MSQEESDNRHPPALGATAADYMVSALKGIASAIPVAGGALAEVFTYIVPNQRADRLEEFLRLLAERLHRLELADLQTRMKQPENVDLIEDGTHQAVRALTHQRLQYIVECVANGIAEDERDKIHRKRLLAILAQLDDEEILLLQAHATSAMAIFEKLRPPPAVIGASQEVMEKNAMWDAAHAKLERLSLLEFKGRVQEVSVEERVGMRPKKIHVSEMDAFGKPSGHLYITHLGRMVLESIGLSTEDQRNIARKAVNE